MSRRNEIKEKERIQLQLQAQFNKLDQTVLSWLKPNDEKPADNDSKGIAEEFVNQVVVPSGKGLNFDDNDEGGKDRSVTISAFLDSTDSRVQSKRKEQNTRNDVVADVKRRQVLSTGNSSRSLQALSNKLRDEKRGKSVGKNVKPQEKFSMRNLAKKNESRKTVESSDEDEEEEDVVVKRKSNFKDKVKSKRPF